ncbi:MAG: site-specific integrase [Acidobacteria bacterium]|nr:site-specific integrase [Acidobacteriota bacterium]
MTRRQPDLLLVLVQTFFQKYLRGVRAASDHTVRAYRDTLRLFFTFLVDRDRHSRRSAADLTLDDIHAEAVLAFLDYVETQRGNSVATRNCRLAALRSFAQHLLRHDMVHAEQYGRILAIASKRAALRVIPYVEPEEARAIIATVGPNTPHAARDRALLLFLYNTGARVSEALAVRPRDLRLDRPRQVRLQGNPCHAYCISFRRRDKATGKPACRQACDLAFSSAAVCLVVRRGIGIGPCTGEHEAGRVGPMSEPFPG